MAILAALLIFTALGGWGSARAASFVRVGPVTVRPLPAIDAAESQQCQRLIRQLPHTLAGQHRRTVANEPDRAAAWGDPVIVLRCGVARPAALTPDAQIYGVNGVEWVTTDHPQHTVWTSTSLSSYVELVIPRAYRDRASTDILNPLAHALRAQGEGHLN